MYFLKRYGCSTAKTVHSLDYIHLSSLVLHHPINLPVNGEGSLHYEFYSFSTMHRSI